MAIDRLLLVLISIASDVVAAFRAGEASDIRYLDTTFFLSFAAGETRGHRGVCLMSDLGVTIN